MEKKYEMIIVLLGTFLMFWISFSILIIGRQLYGYDASLLWFSGILTWMGIIGLSNVILYILNKIENELQK